MPMLPYSLNLAANMQPGNIYNLTAPGSFLAGQPGFQATNLLGTSVAPRLIEAFNQKFSSTMFIMSLEKMYVPDIQWQWFQTPYLNAPLVVAAPGVAASPNGGSGQVTQVVPVSAASIGTVAAGMTMVYPGSTTHGIVLSINTGASTVTLGSYNGVSLPALAAGDELGNGGPRNSDGQAMATSVYQPTQVLYGNTMEQIGYHSVAWDPISAQVFENNGTTNYKAQTISDVTKLFFTSVTHSFFLGGGGIGLLPGGGRSTFSTKGLFKQQADDGVSIVDVTQGNCISAMQEAIYDNSIENGGEEWILAGPSRLLQKFGQGEKAERLRYRIGENTYDSYLNRYSFFGGYNVTPLAIPQFEDRGSWGTGYRDTVLLFKKSDVKLVGLQNWPMFTMGTKVANNQNTSPITGFSNIEMVQYSALMGVQWEKAGFSARFRFLG